MSNFKMDNSRVEAQTDGGLFIEVRNPNPDAVEKCLVWSRHYYVLPLEVATILWKNKQIKNLCVQSLCLVMSSGLRKVSSP